MKRVPMFMPSAPSASAATTIDDIREYVAGAYVKVMQQGDMESGAWSCGMVAGLVRDVPTCRELIDRIMAEADSIVARRLEGMRAG